MKIDSNGDSAEELRRLVHDLRNHLNNIAMNAELAKLQIASCDPIVQSTFSSSASQVISCLTNIVGLCMESADAAEAIAELALPEAL